MVYLVQSSVIMGQLCAPCLQIILNVGVKYAIQGKDSWVGGSIWGTLVPSKTSEHLEW